MKNVNQEILNTLVAEFAKQNKISKGKLTEFANNLVSSVNSGVQQGRKPKEESLELREKLRQELKSGVQFTIPELTQKLGVDAVSLNNAVRYLSINENLFQVVGKGAKKAGERGPKPLIWKAI
tara:strand:+ start:80025 stop:80393 length:369 start_codon:yes stop_codon:yes gene_type:complete